MYSAAATKEKSGMHALYLLTFNNVMLGAALPFRIRNEDRSIPVNLLPFHRRPLAILRTIWALMQMEKRHRKILPLRWDDVKEVSVEIPVGLAGNLEQPNRSKL